ncbi:hypothetical protein [Acidithiobacillus albertensis]|jgi:hypothetical protein|uniref:hypothetical protein n=1 Tax=Acidithiobacillus albertensis TaxID=119978 RepID=UPI00094B469B|nr:hypothetical protein [Acidithiobacillus albertensis]
MTTKKQILQSLIQNATPDELSQLANKAMGMVITQRPLDQRQGHQLARAIGTLLAWLRDTQAISIEAKDIGEIAEFNELYALIIDKRIPMSARQPGIEYIEKYLSDSSQAKRERHEMVESQLKAGLKIMERPEGKKFSEGWADERAKAIEYNVLSEQNNQGESVSVRGMEFLLSPRTRFDTLN